MKMINLAGNKINVYVKSSENARKTVKAEIKSKNQIVITTPQNLKVDVDAFVQKNRRSLEKKYLQFLAKKSILKNDAVLYNGY